jgi:peptidoglycan-associated lipoprotein
MYPVHFETDHHVVHSKDEKKALLQLAGHLKQQPKLILLVEGNCDERASASYNMALGMRRANYVRSFLIEHGARLDQVFAVSKGKEYPIALGHTPEDWSLNRRCEFKVHERS